MSHLSATSIEQQAIMNGWLLLVIECPFRSYSMNQEPATSISWDRRTLPNQILNILEITITCAQRLELKIGMDWKLKSD